MDKKFHVSAINYVLAILAFLFVAFVTYPPPPTAVAQGEYVGRLFGVLLTPTLLAGLVWLISSKSSMAFNVSFPIFLMISVLTTLVGVAERNRLDPELAGMAGLLEQRADLKEDLKSTEVPADALAEIERYAENTQQTFAELAERNDGERQRFFQIMGQHSNEVSESTIRWVTASNMVQELGIPDIASLPESHSNQMENIQDYVLASEAHLVFIQGAMDRLEQRFSVFRDQDVQALARGALAGAQENYDRQLPIYSALLNAHIRYGASLKAFLTLLSRSDEAWTWSGGVLSFSDPEIESEYRTLIAEIIELEDQINELSDQFNDAM